MKRNFGTQAAALIAALAALALAGCEFVPSDPKIYEVTFDANGGTVDGEETKTVEVESGKTTVPPVPEHDSFNFWGWYPGKAGPFGNRFTKDIPVTENITVYARWETTAAPTPYTVTFNANGGTFTGGGNKRTFTVYPGEYVNPLPEVTQGGYTFSGWETGSGSAFTAGTPVNGNTAVSAKWTLNIAFKITGADVYKAEYDYLTGYTFTKVTGSDYDGNYAYTEEWDDDNDEYRLFPLSAYINSPVAVQVKNGKLTVNLGTPKPEYLTPVSDTMTILNTRYPGHTVTVSNTGAKVFSFMDKFYTQDGWGLSYEDDDSSVGLYYASSNVTMTGSFDSGLYIMTFALNLKAGWNYVKNTYSFDNYDYSIIYQTAQPGNNAKWVIYGFEDDPGQQQPDFPPANHTPLTNGQWANGNFTSSGSIVHWYSFTVSKGTTYRIWIDDYDALDTDTTADVLIMAYDRNGTEIWRNYENENWNYPAEFTAVSNGTVYIEVDPTVSGTYRIAYRSGGNSTRP